jgi:hypothetical protein
MWGELYYPEVMSLRPLFAAFSYDQLGSLLFARDPERTVALVRQLGEEQRGARGDFAVRAQAALRQMLTESPQREGPEDEAWIVAAHLLVRQTPSYTAFPESTAWKWSAFSALLDDPLVALAEEPRNLLEAVVLGRPIFGNGFDTGWSFYGCLLANQAQRLSAALGSLDQGTLGPAAPLVDDLRGWITRANQTGPDLWVFWS